MTAIRKKDNSFTQIAERLTVDGIPTETGSSKRDLSSIRTMFTNEKYEGDILFLKAYYLDHITKKQGKRLIKKCIRKASF